MSDKSRLLWHSNSPWAATGYGAQTALFAPRLAETYDVAISAFYGLEGARLAWKNLVVFPGVGRTYGNEVLGGHVERFFGGDRRAGLILTLMDVWVLDPKLMQTFNTACWCPVDHDPVPPAVRQFFKESSAVPIAMSRFGEEQLVEFDPLYVPHGIETDTFKPYDQAESRKMANLPESAFVVGIVAANKGNPSRKSFPEMLEAFAAFRQRHDDAICYLHTEVTQKDDGINIAMLCRALGIPVESVRFCDQYRYQHHPFPPELMARIYSSFDVLLNTSRSEGFGLPVLEAQSCGVLPIVTDFSAMKEVAGSGWHVEAEREWSGQLSFQARPRVEDIVEALEAAYRMPSGLRKTQSEKAREHAQGYDCEKVMAEHFLPALEQVSERFGEREPVELEAAA